MALCCLVPLFLITFLARFPIFRSGGNLLFFLLCPLMMVFMMFGHKSHDHSNHNECKEEMTEKKEKEIEIEMKKEKRDV
ncbi:MAG: DUF2933 domain-containing protein [Actinobacteria bacterium]|nr:DUF2933 domain-containing protein [Actinomycetota bacterium]